MKRAAFFLGSIVFCVSIGAARELEAKSAARAAALAALARDAVSEDGAVADPAIAALRAAGYPGLEALLAERGPVSPRICWSGRGGGAADPWGRWCSAVDRVAAQHDASVSGLYWHTDLEAAKREARAAGKPILSLRLLGRLDEELSCANSRFFRVALYANSEVSKILREHFILH